MARWLNFEKIINYKTKLELSFELDKLDNIILAHPNRQSFDIYRLTKKFHDILN